MARGAKKTTTAKNGRRGGVRKAITVSDKAPEKAVPETPQAEPPINAIQEQKIEASKFYVPETPPAEKRGKREEMPFNYGQDKIVLMVRDPRWVYTYWEITEQKYNEAQSSMGGAAATAKEILRVYDTTQKPWKSFDITIFGGARNWYINVPEPGRSYIVDIGYLTADGRFILLARSNEVKVPREGMSDEIDEEWMTIDFDRIYALSGGFGIGRSSGEIKKLMEKHLKMQSASGWVTSMSSPFGGVSPRPFFLVAHTELIVYGATEPTAELFVQGKKIPLRRDGTFSLRFSLPDGNQTIPIEAIRDDKKEKRSITKKVEKRTL